MVTLVIRSDPMYIPELNTNILRKKSTFVVGYLESRMSRRQF